MAPRSRPCGRRTRHGSNPICPLVITLAAQHAETSGGRDAEREAGRGALDESSPTLASRRYPMSSTFDRTTAFCQRFGLQLPILLAPMAGASSPSLSIAVASAGGLGACGALLMQPEEIIAWAAAVRAGSNGGF